MVTVQYVWNGVWTSSNAKLRESDFQTLLGATFAQVDKAVHKNTHCPDAITLLLSVIRGKTKLQIVAGTTCCEAASEWSTWLYSWVHETCCFRLRSVVWVKLWQQKGTGFQEQLFNIALIQFLLVNLNIVGIGLLYWMQPKGTVGIGRVTFHMKTSAAALKNISHAGQVE
jgi:hypothetical protein